MTKKEKKQEIIDFIESKPENQFSTGLFFVSIGSKYVYYYSIWDKTTNEKMSIEDFYSNYIQ